MDKPKPVPVALIVCDNVYKESRGKTALIGLFNRITVSRFPTRHSRICVYAAVTSVRPTDTYKVEFVHSETDEPAFAAEGPPPGKIDPVGICEFTFTIDNLVLKEPGLYYVRFWGNGYPLMERPITVAQRQEKQAQE